jgi:hypothetical protein
MSFDYAARDIWIDDPVGSFDPSRGYPLCDAHADRMTPPLGWALTDRRGRVRPLFIALEVA